METTKNVKVSFHTLVKKAWKTEKSQIDEEPFYMIEKVIDYIGSIADVRNRYYDLKSGKFCFIDSFNKEVIDEQVTLIKGVFKSARNEFRPNLINKRTGKERKNPKELSEGDIELTHFLLKLSQFDNEVYLLIELNHTGVTPINFVNYINEFTKQYLQSVGQTKNFFVNRMEVPMNNFLTELERLRRTAQAEIYFDKQLLGSKALNFSERTLSVRQEVMLTAKASTRDSITELGVDLWNAMNREKSPISRIRIKGADDSNNEIILDTTLLGRKEHVTVDVNQETGVINSTQLLSELRKMAIAF